MLASAASPRPAAVPARGPGDTGPEVGFLHGTGQWTGRRMAPRAPFPRTGSAEVPGREPEVSSHPTAAVQCHRAF